MLQEAVAAFRQLDVSDLSLEDAVRRVAQCHLHLKMGALQVRIRRVVFASAPHIGPYVATFNEKGTDVMWLVFGARLPEGVQRAGPSATG